MGDLIEKSEDGYTLTPLGVEAYSMLHGNVEKPPKTMTAQRLVAVILLAVILVSAVYYVYSMNQWETIEGRRMANRQTLLNHTNTMMVVIVNAFEYVDVPRSVWTEILLQSTLLQKDIEAMQDDDDPLTPTQLVPKIGELVTEAKYTLSGSDSEYLALSRENRLLLRDLYGELFEVKKSLR
jgi:hypothetical protein